MNNHYLLAAAIILTVSPAALADNDDLTLEKQCKISRAKAQQIACKRVVGTVTDTDVEKTSTGKLYWSIDVKPTAGLEKEIHIDGLSGAVLSVENDND